MTMTIFTILWTVKYPQLRRLYVLKVSFIVCTLIRDLGNDKKRDFGYYIFPPDSSN